MSGTNYGVYTDGVTYPALTDQAGNIVFGWTSALPSGTAGFAVGCILILTTTGIPYCNTGAGTALVCAFAKVSGT